MIITSISEGMIDGITLKRGTHNYPIDHTNPATAAQLRNLRDEMQTISFGEILEGDRVKELKAKIQDPKNDWTEEDVKKLGKDKKRIAAPGQKLENDEVKVTRKVEKDGKEEEEFDWNVMTNADAVPILNAMREKENSKEKPKAQTKKPKVTNAGGSGKASEGTKRENAEGSG